MKLNKLETIVFVSTYSIIIVDILLWGIMLDLIAILMGIALFLFSIKIKQLNNIFFVSAIVFIILAIILYSINSEYLPYNSAANWAYFFFLFGIIKMFFEISYFKKS